MDKELEHDETYKNFRNLLTSGGTIHGSLVCSEHSFYCLDAVFKEFNIKKISGDDDWMQYRLEVKMTNKSINTLYDEFKELDSNRVQGIWKRIGPFDSGKIAPLPSNSYRIIKELDDYKEWQFTICGAVDHQIANKDADNFAFIEAAPALFRLLTVVIQDNEKLRATQKVCRYIFDDTEWERDYPNIRRLIDKTLLETDPNREIEL